MIRAESKSHFLARQAVRDLADLIDQAAAAPTAEDQGGRAFEHLDRVGREKIAVVLADVAHAIDEDILIERETAQIEQYIGLGSAFGCRVADPGRVAQCLVTAWSRFASESALAVPVDELRDVAKRCFGARPAAS